MTTAQRRVIYLSGSRADFGLMRAALGRIDATHGMSLKVLATGMHLSHEHGHTIDEVRAAGFEVCGEAPLDMNTRTGRSMALGVAECLRAVTDILDRERPDILLLLGDRGEMLAGAVAALHLGIPSVHVHGGERSGTVDEPVRHAISKLATHHFVATAASRERLIAMGEWPDRVHVTGAPGLDGLRELSELSRPACLSALGLDAQARFILVLFHPVVQQAWQAREQTNAVAAAVTQAATPVIWLEPNADAGALGVLQALDEAVLPPGSRRVKHLPRGLFAAALRHCEALVGNSSAGMIEAATCGAAVVNVGDRQRLRERAANVIDAQAETAAITAALAQALARATQNGRREWENPYGDGHAGERIASLLATLPLDAALLEKYNRY